VIVPPVEMLFGKTILTQVSITVDFSISSTLFYNEPSILDLRIDVLRLKLAIQENPGIN
jgi:hypothetical protein